MPAGNLTTIARNRTLTRVAGYAVLVGLYAGLPVWKEYSRFRDVGDLPAEIHAALTLVLGWVLVFRTNTSYARWWEARTLWGGLVNSSRNLAIKVADLVRAEDADLVRFRTKIVAFAHALKNHLREESDLRSLPGFEHESDDPAHVPGYLVTRMYERLADWKKAGFIDGDELRVLDEEARRFLDICGGCERIKNTRLARSYRAFARQCVLLFLATFPWGIAHDFQWWTIPLTAITAYFMIGLETVAEHVEEPFGHDVDDLDLEGLCATIERSVCEIFDRRLQRVKGTSV
jgi:ion channel-forming bestrophin family protein